MESIYNATTLEKLKTRIESLSLNSKPLWGAMTVVEMMAHTSLVFEYNNGKRLAKVNPILRFLLAPMMRSVIIGPKPYKRNSPTAPYFKVDSPEDFDVEKSRLLLNLTNFSTQDPEVAARRKHVWLGALSAEEWSWAMIKHLDHHLNQFGV